MLGSKASKNSLKIGSKVQHTYPKSLGSKYSVKYQHAYVPVKDGQNLFTHKKSSPLEKTHFQV